MNSKEIEIILGRGEGDPGISDVSYQTELNAFAEALRTANIDYSQRAIAYDSIDAHGFPLGEFFVALTVAAHALQPAIVAWIKTRKGRSVTIKFGAVEISAGSLDEVERLLERYTQFVKDSGSLNTMDEISDEGKARRFAHWEKHGVERIKNDLLNGGFGLVGGPPQVRELAWEWVRAKEALASSRTEAMQYFVSWIMPDGTTSRFAHPHPTLDSALDFACEGFRVNASDIWIEDADGQKVADRVRIAQYADSNGKPYN